MFSGYNGRILFVNLTKAEIYEKELDEQVYRLFIGGLGLGVRILYEHMKPKEDPLGPENMIGFLVGPLTGTGIHGARYQLVGKSPLTGGWGDCNSGGRFAASLKASGYDGIFCTGISPKPVYLFVDNGKVEIRNATHLWGNDTVETDNNIKSELNDLKVSVSCIGPAGEACSLSAAVMHEGCAAARSGLGAVMGSKRLKAVVTRGNYKVSIADPQRFAILRKIYLESYKSPTNPVAKIFKNMGTCGVFSSSILVADTPIKNWSRFGEHGFPSHDNLDGHTVIKYQTKKHACLGCPVSCKGWMTIQDDTYSVIKGTKVEYETLGMLGSNCLVDNLAAVAKANDLCNRYGLDTINVGSAIGFAMDCYERGIINNQDTDGVDLTWGNDSAMVTMVEKICRREGFGAVLADGCKLASERIGKGSESLAPHLGGQDLPAHDPRASIGHGWGYITDPTPARHTASHAKHSHDSHLPTLVDYNKVSFPELDSSDVSSNAPIFAICSDIERLVTSAGLCCFTLWSELPLFDVLSSVTGWNYEPREWLEAGRRIQTLRQIFNIREGIDTSKWTLPKKISNSHFEGPIKGKNVDFKAMKEKGYEALGWDPYSGKPLESTLEGLGLKELVY